MQRRSDPYSILRRSKRSEGLGNVKDYAFFVPWLAAEKLKKRIRRLKRIRFLRESRAICARSAQLLRGEAQRLRLRPPSEPCPAYPISYCCPSLR
ncbi:protein of unknown function [Pararobbsia alpina]